MAERPALLLLPGMMCDYAAWQAQIDGLADLCSPRLVDFRDADSIEAMADIALSQAPARFALAGHSMGGRVAQAVYRLAPERISHLALLATDFRAPLDEAERAAEAARRDGMLSLVGSIGLDAFARNWTRQVVAPSRLDDEPLLLAVAEMMMRHTPAQLAAQTLAGLTRPDFADLLPTISCPTLLIAGAKDTLRPVETLRGMASRIPHAKLLVFEDCGHMIAMEHPQQTTDAMRAWLAA